MTSRHEEFDLTATGPQLPLLVAIETPRLGDVALINEPRFRLRFSRSLTPFEAKWVSEHSESPYEDLEHEEGSLWSIPVLTLLPENEATTPQLVGYQLSVMAEMIENGGREESDVAAETVTVLQEYAKQVNAYLEQTPRSSSGA